jgi:hypothetical protein
MSKPQVKIVNTQTGEEIIRDATAEEIAQMAKDAQETSEREAEAEARAAQKAALLNKLGITEDEARLLLGGN